MCFIIYGNFILNLIDLLIDLTKNSQCSEKVGNTRGKGSCVKHRGRFSTKNIAAVWT